MKKALFILALSTLPAVSLAAGIHVGGHAASEHSMGGHGMSTPHETASAIGQPGDLAKVARTVELTMSDTMRFTPDAVQVRAGETVRFVISNQGKMAHEMVIGSIADLKAHAAEMQKAPTMQHTEPNMITLEPGEHGSLVWQFGRAGTVDFACLIPGHLEAGMIGKVTVD